MAKWQSCENVGCPTSKEITIVFFQMIFGGEIGGGRGILSTKRLNSLPLRI
jgi:hypothetical protein